MKLWISQRLRIAFVAAAFVATGSLVGTAKEAPAKSEFPNAFCTHKLNADQSPSDHAEAFAQADTIYLSMEVKGRPKTGKAEAKFFYLEQLIDEAKVDLSSPSKQVGSSKSGNTFIGFELRPPSPLPVGVGCRAELTWNGKSIGAYPFRISPPEGAIPSSITSVKLAKGVDDSFIPQNETREFVSNEKVFLVGSGKFGIESRFWVDWYVSGKLDDAGTKSFTMTENKEKLPFSFSFLPAGGWPAGKHEVVIMLDGKEAVREKFTIKADVADASKMSEFQKGLKGLVDDLKANKTIQVRKVTLFRDDGAGKPGESVTEFAAKDLHLHVEFSLDLPVNASGAKVVWTLVKAGKHADHPLATVELTEGGLNDFVASNLNIESALPAGDYKVELLKDDKVLGSKAFQIK